MRTPLVNALFAIVFGGVGAVAGMLLATPLPPPVADQPPTTLRRLQIRLHADLDKPGARGDRYRMFECREVPRGK